MNKSVTRGIVLVAAVVTSIVVIAIAATEVYRHRKPAAPPVDVAKVKNIRQKLHKALAARVANGPLARHKENYIYTVDIAQLFIYAARSGDRDLYDRLRRHLIDRAIVLVPDNPKAEAHGMVRWRVTANKDKIDPSCESSGTTETIRTAQGLWIGAKRFNLPDDRDLALTLLRAYCRHEYFDPETEIWIIRNYYNMDSPHFATNTFLVDYDPDFLAEVAAQTAEKNDADLFRRVAEKSYDVVERAQTPVGLMYDLVQPEVSTLMPHRLAYFSPNDVVCMNNAPVVIERVARGDPRVAQRFLTFVRRDYDRLKYSYYGRTGEPCNPNTKEDLAGFETWPLIARIAIAMKQDDLRDLAVAKLLPEAQQYADEFSDKTSLFRTSDALLTLLAIEEQAAATQP